MNRTNWRLCLSVICAACLCAGLSRPAVGQVGGVKGAGEAIQKGKEKVDQAVGKKPAEQKSGEKKAEAAPGGAQTVFSGSPIDPAKPANLATTFKAGDHIYGLIQVEKTWRELLAKGSKDATKVEVPIEMLVDGEKVDFQYITIKKLAAIDGKVLVLEVAPEPEKMTSYKDPGFEYAEGKGRRKIGPDTYTYNLAELKPGKHTVRFQVQSYGDIFSAGEFTIEGGNYKYYAELREKILKEASAVATMPPAQMVDKELEATMRKLLENAGWKSIRKLVIVDKDWWIDRVAGSDTAIESRHIGAAAATKADDGTFYWCNLTFHQRMKIDGSYGPLELTDTGVKRPILEENIDK